jgi:hypothetical protein
MRYHFTISYSDDFGQVNDWLYQRAAEDPLMAQGGNFVVVAAAEGLAKWQQEQLDAGRSIIEGVAVIEVFPEASTFRVDLECGEAEREAVTRLLNDMFQRFANYSVYDEDRGEQIADPARKDARQLIHT